ncbi:hypothetical protein [Litoreibacter sp.]|uniref:hypothetical protein n=1 Tax=Litoreibacter sp. TaxID=1969459 RepID=UPI0032991866
MKSKASHKSLLGSAVGYGVIEGLAAYLFSITIFAAAFYLLQSDGELADALNAKSFRDPMAALSRQIAFGTLTVLGALSAIFGMILRAALLPALASAAAGCDPNSHRHTVYDGVGEKFPQMMGLLAMIAVISTVLLPFIGEASQYIGLTSVLVEKLQTLLQAVTGDRDLVFDLTLAIAIFLAISFSVWLFCLQCAGAALSYESRVTDEVQVKMEAVKSREASHVDIAALRRARMNNIGR